MLPQVTMEARLVADPELRFSTSGIAIGSLRLVSSSRKKNDAGEWVDDKTCWIDATCFRQIAENVAESLRKGDMVLVQGKLETQEWEDRESGAKRSKISLVVDEIGPTLRFRKVLHSDGAGGKVTREGASSNPSPSDPWATPEPMGAPDEPPF